MKRFVKGDRVKIIKQYDRYEGFLGTVDSVKQDYDGFVITVLLDDFYIFLDYTVDEVEHFV